MWFSRNAWLKISSPVCLFFCKRDHQRMKVLKCGVETLHLFMFDRKWPMAADITWTKTHPKPQLAKEKPFNLGKPRVYPACHFNLTAVCGTRTRCNHHAAATTHRHTATSCHSWKGFGHYSLVFEGGKRGECGKHGDFQWSSETVVPLCGCVVSGNQLTAHTASTDTGLHWW